jgi:type I restriction enzyme S subunit
LNQPSNGDATAFRQSASFHLKHLSRVTTRPEQINRLRQTILDLAVRGQLVKQNTDDEPASKLLARKVGLPDGYKRKRKILKAMSIAAPEELFSEIPSLWEYREIQDLYDLNVIIDYADGNHGALYPRATEFGDSGVTFVTAKDLLLIWFLQQTTSGCGTPALNPRDHGPC